MHFTVKIKPVNNHGPVLNVSPSKIPVDEGAAVVITDAIISIRNVFKVMLQLERHQVSTKLKTYLSDKDTPKDQLTICLNEPFEHGILENVNPDNGGEIPRIGQSIECFTAEELEQGLFWVKFLGKIFG